MTEIFKAAQINKWPKIVRVNYDPGCDLGYMQFYESDIYLELYSCCGEVVVEGFGQIYVDVGVNGEILGIESLEANKHFPKWVLEQASK